MGAAAAVLAGVHPSRLVDDEVAKSLFFKATLVVSSGSNVVFVSIIALKPPDEIPFGSLLCYYLSVCCWVRYLSCQCTCVV